MTTGTTTKTTTTVCEHCGYTHIYEEKISYKKQGFVGVISPTPVTNCCKHVQGNRYFTKIHPTADKPATKMRCPICKKITPISEFNPTFSEVYR